MNRTFETNRLLIRPFVIGDAEGIFNTWQNDPRVFQYIDSEPYHTLEESLQHIQDRIIHYDKEMFFDHVMVLKDTNTPIGEINGVYSKKKHSMDIGYILGKKYWKKNYMLEALSKIIETFFAEYQMNVIYAESHKDNLASIHLLNKLGMHEIKREDDLIYYELQNPSGLRTLL